jgi:hypothetical protein
MKISKVICELSQETLKFKWHPIYITDTRIEFSFEDSDYAVGPFAVKYFFVYEQQQILYIFCIFLGRLGGSEILLQVSWNGVGQH